MEEMMKLQRTCGSNRVNHLHQPALSMHKDSHVISKFKPKIRIVHIFAPEIIKTDVANFRELVQRLTGKPSSSSSSSDRKACKKKGAAIIRTSTSTHDHDQVSSSSRSGTTSSSNYKFSNQLQPKMISTDQSSSDGFQSSGPNSGYGYGGDGIKEEEEVIWGGENSSANNFFGLGFNDFEGFIQGLNHEYPFLPLMNNSSTHLDLLGEPFLT